MKDELDYKREIKICFTIGYNGRQLLYGSIERQLSYQVGCGVYLQNKKTIVCKEKSLRGWIAVNSLKEIEKGNNCIIIKKCLLVHTI